MDVCFMNERESQTSAVMLCCETQGNDSRLITTYKK